MMGKHAVQTRLGGNRPPELLRGLRGKKKSMLRLTILTTKIRKMRT